MTVDALPRTLRHRLLGWHSPSLQRVLVAGGLGLITALATGWWTSWILGSLLGWTVGSVYYLAAVWLVIARVDGEMTHHLSIREDPTRSTAGLLLLGASVASLAGVGYGLYRANQDTGGMRVALTVASIATVVLSWALVNTVFTLRYAHLYFTEPLGGVQFAGDHAPDYRDFAYLAFTVGMTYQVSDTGLDKQAVRRTVLRHAMLAYLFGTVIVATTINIVASFVG